MNNYADDVNVIEPKRNWKGEVSHERTGKRFACY